MSGLEGALEKYARQIEGGMIGTDQHFEALRAHLHRSRPPGVSVEQIDASMLAARPAIVAKIVGRARGHAYRVGARWYVDAGLIERVAAAFTVTPAPRGWTIGLAGDAIACERVREPRRLPAQRGPLYMCAGGEAHIGRLVDACGLDAVFVGFFATWPEAGVSSGCGHSCGCKSCREEGGP